MNYKFTLPFLIIILGCTHYNCSAQIHNEKIVSVMVYGNCGMCKKTIEKAAFKAGISEVIWDKSTKIAKLTFDSTKVKTNDLLMKIAAAGYDSENFRAKDVVYDKLPECCQYDRPKKKS